MLRNEKGQFIKDDEVSYETQIKEAEARLAELKKAQAEKIEEKKRAAALARKEEAQPVIDSIIKYEEAKVVCNEKIKTAYEAYRAAVDAAEKELHETEEAADNELNKFLDTHSEGFHYTYRSKDGKVVREYNYRKQAYSNFDNYNAFIKAINDLWKF